MHAKFVSSLSSVQTFLIMSKGFLWLCGVNVPWVIVLAPLWILVFMAFIFWFVVGVIFAKLG